MSVRVIRKESSVATSVGQNLEFRYIMMKVE